METQLLEQANTQEEFKSDVKELALNDNASGYLYLHDGGLAVALNSFEITDYVLPLTVTHAHKQGLTETAYGKN